MADPSVNRRLFFGFDDDDDYTENDLERDLKKTQTLPFAQIGTPSPYRAPPKSRIAGPAKTVVAIKPLVFKQPAQAVPVEVNPETLKTPVSNRGGSKLVQAALPEPVEPAVEPVVALLPAPVFNQAPSVQKPTVKVIPSRYMQAAAPKNAAKENLGVVAISKPSQASSKKPSNNSQKKPLSTLTTDANVLIDAEKRRQTTIGAKKIPATSQTASTAANRSSRSSVGPQSSHSATQISQAAQTSTSASQAALQTTSVTVPSVPATPSIYHSQTDLRAEVIRRREQRLAQAAAKQTGAANVKNPRPSIGGSTSSAAQQPTTSRESIGPLSSKTPHDGRKSIQRHSSSLAGMRASSNLVSSGSSASLASQSSSASSESNSSVKVVPSRYMNFKSEAPSRDSTVSRLSIDGSEDVSSAAPTPTRTPRGTLKKSFSTSSLKKEHPTSRKVSAAEIQQEKATSAMSARVAAAVVTSVTTQAISSEATVKKPAVVNVQALQLETQLLQSQLLQWHFIVHRLEQAYVAKRASAVHMMTAVWHKIVALEASLKVASENLAESQARVYQVELEHFKVQCMAPLLREIHEFMFRYAATASSLAQDTHKMPALGVSPISSAADVRALLSALHEGTTLLDALNTEFQPQITGWQHLGATMHTLTAIVQDEAKDLKNFAEMLHALASLNTHEASLILHKIQLQQQQQAE